MMPWGSRRDDGVVGDLADQQPQPLLALAQGDLERVLLGEVTGHLGVSGEVARVVVQGGDDHVAPEAGAVLADPPALVLDAARVGLGEELAGQTAAAILLG